MKMNKKIFLPVLAVALMLAGSLLSSCSSNNEKLEIPTAKTATLKSVLYIMDPMLDYCDMTVTYDGTTTTITADNTTATTYMGYDVREYVILNQSYSTFPQTITMNAKCQPKAGYDFSKLEKADYCFAVIHEFGNDNDNKFGHLGYSETFLPGKGFKFATATEAQIQKRVNADITSTVSFTSASEADVK